MKSNLLILSTISLVSVLIFGSCSTHRTVAFRDDVYQSRGKALERTYQSPDYYYEDPQNTQVANTDYSDDYYDDGDVYSDEGYYSDEYSDSEYANRINRFYYADQGMNYFDPWYGSYFGYDPFFYGYGNPYFSSYYSFNPWYRHYGGFRMGWGSSFYSPYHPWGWGGYPYYGSSYWGPYSYNGWGHGHWGNPYPHYPSYGGTHRNMSVRSDARDNINVRTAGSSGRGSSASSITREENGRIVTRPTVGAGSTSRTGTTRTEGINRGSGRTEGIRTGVRPGTRNEGINTGVVRPGGSRTQNVRPGGNTGTQQRPTTMRPTTRPAGSASGTRSAAPARPVSRGTSTSSGSTSSSGSRGTSVAPPTRATGSSGSSSSGSSSSSSGNNSNNSNTRTGSRGG